MNQNFPVDDPALSDALLSKADALIRRNRPDGVGTDAEELPLLTDELDDLPELMDSFEELEVVSLDDDEELDPHAFGGHRELALETEQDPAPFGITQDELDEAVQKAVEHASMRVAEQLIELDSFIAQTMESWISTELPQLLASEMEGMVERLRIKTLAQMRATLLPDLSGKLSEILESSLKNDNN